MAIFEVTDAVNAHRIYLDAQGRHQVDAQANILHFLGVGVEEGATLASEVRMAAADSGAPNRALRLTTRHAQASLQVR